MSWNIPANKLQSSYVTAGDARQYSVPNYTVPLRQNTVTPSNSNSDHGCKQGRHNPHNLADCTIYKTVKI